MKRVTTIECKYCHQHKSRANFMHYGALSETCVHCGHAKRDLAVELDVDPFNPDPEFILWADLLRGIGYAKDPETIS